VVVVVEEDKLLQPMETSLLGADRIMFNTNKSAGAIQEFFLSDEL
jgi:hypothetical protein